MNLGFRGCGFSGLRFGGFGFREARALERGSWFTSEEAEGYPVQGLSLGLGTECFRVQFWAV